MKNAFGIFGEMTARWNPDTVLDSVKHGELKTLRHFFDQGCPIDLELNPNRDTALIVACRLGLLDVARLMLLEYGAPNDPHPDYGHTALQHAVSSGHKSIVRLILDCAAPSGLDAVIVNHTDAHGEAPIHVACRCGSLDILQLLIEGGANVGVVDARGRTCLHLASQQGHASCLLCVLEAGADDFIEVRDDGGWKCLDLAVRANKMESVQVLLQTGAKVSADAIELASKKPKILQLLLEYTAEDIDRSIESHGDESCSSSSVESRRSSIFSGLNTYIASPELFRTPMSTEENEEEMMDRECQFRQNSETWTIHFTEEGYRYFYNTDRDYSAWDDPRSKRVYFEQHSDTQTESQRSHELSLSYPGVPYPYHHSSQHTVKEECVKPTTIAKSPSEKETSPEETEIMTRALEEMTSDPKSILFAQTRFRRDKKASASDSEPSIDITKPKHPSPKTDHPVAKAADPKSILLAQIRARERNANDKELTSPKPTKASVDTNDVFDKYRKMKTVGVPLPAISQRMSRDGLSDSLIQLFQQQATTADESTPPSHPHISSTKTIQPSKFAVASPAKPPAQQQGDLLKDKSLSKYIQMTKVGVPAAAVAMKMSQDGIDDNKINSFRVAYGLEASSKKARNQLSAAPNRRSSRAMQKVHWSIINEEKLQNSLWTLSTPDIDAKISQKELEELESLFSASPRPSAKTAMGSKRSKGIRTAKQISATFIEQKRANNINISLAQYRAFNNFDDLVTAVASLDDNNLNAEKVNNMTSLLPTRSELNQLNQLNGQVAGLGQAELFFVALAKMPNFQQKLFSFRYLLQFDEQMNTLKTNLETLEKGCIEVMTSKNLAFVCKKLLQIGNIFNAQNATGITLSSLIKIAQKKGGDGKISVIDHLISTVDSSDICFHDDMPTIRECTRLDLNEMKLSLMDIEAGAKSVDSTIKAEQSMTYAQDERPKHSMDFLSRISPFHQRAEHELKTMNDLFARVTNKVDELKRFFCEEHSSTSSSIFSSLVDFSRIVETSNLAHHRKQRRTRTHAVQTANT